MCDVPASLDQFRLSERWQNVLTQNIILTKKILFVSKSTFNEGKEAKLFKFGQKLNIRLMDSD